MSTLNNQPSASTQSCLFVKPYTGKTTMLISQSTRKALIRELLDSESFFYTKRPVVDVIVEKSTYEKKGKKKVKISRKLVYGAETQVFNQAAFQRALLKAEKAISKGQELEESVRLVIDMKVVKSRLAAKVKAASEVEQANKEREEARLYSEWLQSQAGEIARIERQLEVLRNASPVNFGKVRKKDAPKAKVKAAKVRSGKIPARIAVPFVQLPFTGKLAPVSIPCRDIKVSREEAQAILLSIAERKITHKAQSTISVINTLKSVDDLIDCALLAIATGEAFTLAAKARIEQTKQSLPQVAQAMTMELDNLARLKDIFNTPVDRAISFWKSQENMLLDMIQMEVDDYGCSWDDAHATQHDEWLNDTTVADLAVLIVAQDTMDYWNHESLAEHLDSSVYEYIKAVQGDCDCFPFGREYVDSKGKFFSVESYRGDGNLSKNVTVVEEDPSSAIPTSTNEDSPMTNVNADAFASASAFKYGDIPVSYSEVEPLIDFGLAEKLVNFNNEGSSFADILASLMYKTEELQKPLPSETEEDVLEINATITRKNERAMQSREKFLNLFGGKLGYVKKANLHFGVKSSYAKSSLSLKYHFESMFTMIEAPLYEGAEHTYTGLELDEFAPTYFISNESAPALWLCMLARATFNLSIDERAQLLGLLFHDIVRVKDNVVTRDKVSIDIANGVIVTGNGRVLKVNKASCFGKSDGGFVIFDGLHTLFLFALQALGGTSKQLETSINLAVKLFQPAHNYGLRPDHDDMAHFVRTNLIYTNAVKHTNTDFPSVEVIGGKQSPELLGWVLNCGVIATCDKTNIKFITINSGAEAVGVGYTRDEAGHLKQMFTANDANKPTKLFNRASANSYNCAELLNASGLNSRVASNFGFALSNGKVARTKGQLMKVAFTNSLLTFGSGVAAINPNSSFSFSIDKKESAPINITLFGYENINKPKAKKAIVAKIVEAINAVKGQVFAPGEVIISLDHEGQEYKLVSNSEKAAEVVVKGGKVRDNVLDENSFEIIVDVALLGDSGFVKTRRFATKFTTLPYEVEFVGHNQEWDIILNNECTKGNGGLLEMYCNATGERHLNTNTCDFTTPDGDSFNLLSESNPFYTWKDENIHENVKLRMTIAKSVWDNMERFCKDTVVVVQETKDNEGYPCVIVEETCDVIYGELVFDVEISSPLENVSSSNMTLESASAVYLQSKRIGNILFEECLTKADKFVALAKRFSAVDINDMHFVDLDDDGSFNSFILTALPSAGDSDGDEQQRLTQRQLISCLAVKFPQGIEFVAGNSTFPLNAGLVASFGSFNGLNGSASREAAEIMNFLLDVFNNGASDRKKLMAPAKRAFNRIVNTAVSSKKVLKKPTRAGKLIYGKVRTSFHPMLHSEDGIPTVVMNTNCPMVRMLGIPTTGLLVDYFVAFARTPMPFLGGARVRLTNDSSICDVAHVLVDPYVWHCLNEGDSDGDGIAMLNLAHFNVTKEEVIEMNSSIMGIAGYEHLYGDNVPYADFVSEEDKATKKCLRGIIKLISTQVKNPDTGKSVDITRDFVADFADRVANHYKSAVGTSYGICSKLVFQAADWAADESQDITNLLTATLVAWRAMYEGLGLSGYSAKAARVFNIINLATTDLECYNLLVNDKGDIASVWDKEFKAQNPECVELNSAEILKLEFEDLFVPLEVFEFIIDSRAKTKVAVRLEGFGRPLTKWHYGIPNLIEGATKYGVLRRISQGDDRVAEELGLKEEAELAAAGEHVSVALSRRFHKKADEMSEHFSNELLYKLTLKVCEFHTELLMTQGKNRDAENRS